EALLFPEVSTLGDDREFLHYTAEHNAQHLLQALDAVALHRRHAPDAVEVIAVPLTLEPPTRAAAWRTPVTLSFPAVRWAHGEDAQLAFVPALGIEVVAPTPEDLERLLPAHVRAALFRTKAAHSLGTLALLQRCRSLRGEPLTVTARVQTP